MSDVDGFIHSFGNNNFFASLLAGNLTMPGIGSNTGIAMNSLSSNATGRNSLRFNTKVDDTLA